VTTVQSRLPPAGLLTAVEAYLDDSDSSHIWAQSFHCCTDEGLAASDGVNAHKTAMVVGAGKNGEFGRSAFPRS
jgi:hypothetical protein